MVERMDLDSSLGRGKARDKGRPRAQWYQAWRPNVAERTYKFSARLSNRRGAESPLARELEKHPTGAGVMDLSAIVHLGFTDAGISDRIDALSGSALDALDFGVIGFDAETVVRLYNDFEAKASGLSPHRVLGHPLFTVVAPCMNNFMVAQRFEDAAANGAPLDATIDYVLTLRMKPVRVNLRLLSTPGKALRHLLVNRPR